MPARRNPYDMLENAIKVGWHAVDNIQPAGEGEFLVLKMSGFIRRARSIKTSHRTRFADSCSPARMTIVSVESGNYLAAIAWRWAEVK